MDHEKPGNLREFRKLRNPGLKNLENRDQSENSKLLSTYGKYPGIAGGGGGGGGGGGCTQIIQLEEVLAVPFRALTVQFDPI